MSLETSNEASSLSKRDTPDQDQDSSPTFSSHPDSESGAPDRKRLRTSSHTTATPSIDAVHPSSPNSLYTNSSIPLRRRVNPESLAKRLGAELVHDLDALILPGNFDMPSFAARRELQERYDIDRRHIYDYFHSKGLRVVKEDKHGNPIRESSPLVSQMPTARLLRHAPPRAIRSLPTVIKKTTPRLPAAARAPARVREKKQHPVTRPRASSPAYVPPTEMQSPRYFSLVNPIQQSYPIGAMEDKSCTQRSGSISDYWSPAITTPATEPNSVNSPFGTPYSMSICEEDLLREPVSISLTPSNHFPPADSQDQACDMSIPLDQRVLPQDEREAFYAFMSKFVGPAVGIQESVGTYTSRMAERSRAYFDHLLSHTHPTVPRKAAPRFPTLVETSSELSSRSSSNDDIPKDEDFRKWLICAAVSQNDPPSARSQVKDGPTQRNEVVVSDPMFSLDFTDPRFGPGLDDLFPDFSTEEDTNTVGVIEEQVPEVHEPKPERSLAPMKRQRTSSRVSESVPRRFNLPEAFPATSQPPLLLSVPTRPGPSPLQYTVDQSRSLRAERLQKSSYMTLSGNIEFSANYPDRDIRSRTRSFARDKKAMPSPGSSYSAARLRTNSAGGGI